MCRENQLQEAIRQSLLKGPYLRARLHLADGYLTEDTLMHYLAYSIKSNRDTVSEIVELLKPQNGQLYSTTSDNTEIRLTLKIASQAIIIEYPEGLHHGRPGPALFERQGLVGRRLRAQRHR